MSELHRFDIDQLKGKQGELFVEKVRAMLRDGSIEVKADEVFLQTLNFYIELECLHRDGVWRASGIAHPDMIAEGWFLAFGPFPAGLYIETEWLKRAVKRALSQYRRGSCMNSDCPTKGALVTVRDIVETREG